MEISADAGRVRQAGPRSGLVWYAAALPILGLFLENFAMNKYHGYLIWGIVLFMRPLCCVLDRRCLRESGYDMGPAYIAVLPTVYLFKRCMTLRHNMAVAVVCIIALSYGVIGNGFTVGLMTDDERILRAVQNQSVTSIDALEKENSADSISQALENSAKDINWTIERSGDLRYVSVTFTVCATGAKAELDLTVTHDGFTYTDFSYEKTVKDGKELKDDEEKDFLKSLLIKE